MNRTIHLFVATVVALIFGVAAANADTAVVHVNASAEWVSTGLWVEPGQTYAVSTVGRSFTVSPRYPDFRPQPANASGRPGESGPEGQIYICTSAPGFECALEGAPYGQLVGSVSGTAFAIGGASTFTVPSNASAGYLQLAVNDYLGYYSDNSAGYTVTIG